MNVSAPLPVCTPAHCPGIPGARVAFLLSCPGTEELRNGRPIAGITGERVTELLRLASTSTHSGIARLFPSTQRYHYVIVNCWDRVESDQLTGRSEASFREIRSASNLQRIRKELGTVEIVIALGGRAHQALTYLEGDFRTVQARHPSRRGLATIPSDKATSSERDRHRVEQWCEGILEDVCLLL